MLNVLRARLMMAVSKEVSQKERTDASTSTGVIGKSKEDFESESRDQQDADTLEIEELAAMYVSIGGTDARAKKIFDDAKEAGRIDANGDWIDQG